MDNMNMNIKNNIAANIAFFRKKNKITQQQLAELLNAKNTTVSTWERGSSLPDAETLFAICQILHVSLSEMYGCDAVPADAMIVSDIEKEIIIEYRKSDDIAKAMVLRALAIDEKIANGKGDVEKMA